MTCGVDWCSGVHPPVVSTSQATSTPAGASNMNASRARTTTATMMMYSPSQSYHPSRKRTLLLKTKSRRTSARGYYRRNSVQNGICAVNPYHILGLRRDANIAEIRTAYKRLALWYHPGRGRTKSSQSPSSSSSIQMFEILAACYETLISNESRRRYDNQLKDVERELAASRCTLLEKKKMKNTQHHSIDGKSNIKISHTATLALQGRDEVDMKGVGVDGSNGDDVDVDVEYGSDDEDTVTLTIATSSVWGDTESKRPMLNLHQRRRRIWHKNNKKKKRMKKAAKNTGRTTDQNHGKTGRSSPCGDDTDESMPVLVRSSSSQSASEEECVDNSDPTTTMMNEPLPPNCSSIGSGLLLCYHPAITPSYYSSDSSPSSTDRINHNKATWRRTMVKQATTRSHPVPRSMDRFPKSLADYSSSTSTPSSSTDDDEAEQHFSEEVVNRLFGGPLAPLHRARNFSPFTDPYVVFEKVFGSNVFPRPDNNNGHHQQLDLSPIECENNANRLVRSLTRNTTSREGSDKTQLNGWTTVNEKSRMVGNRVITRTETMRTSPFTGRKVLSIVVEGGELESTIALNQPDSAILSYLECLTSLFCPFDFDPCRC
jgi:curved DNA-binding protein CbpA